jgi:hypothetical protein
LRHFIAYHNQEEMGYSCTAITEPHVKTANPVEGLEGVKVWLIAGEGKSPKAFFLAAMFVAEKCETDFYTGTDLPNNISGTGKLFGKSIGIGRNPIYKLIKKD